MISTARMASAPMMPTDSTLAWNRSGTANPASTTANTKMLSTESVFSTAKPVTYSMAGVGPASRNTPTPNSSASAT
ncbi:MAG TPA: hypothetical protein VHV49_10490 [Pseudonocardiaceae bacterium]|jgi:hypothetical protein|nr:hypothetical protein [Pseudonocardiaceae bacterium]